MDNNLTSVCKKRRSNSSSLLLQSCRNIRELMGRNLIVFTAVRTTLRDLWSRSLKFRADRCWQWIPQCIAKTLGTTFPKNARKRLFRPVNARSPSVVQAIIVIYFSLKNCSTIVSMNSPLGCLSSSPAISNSCTSFPSLIKPTYPKSIASLPGRVDSPNCEPNCWDLSMLYNVSSMSSVISSILLRTELLRSGVA